MQITMVVTGMETVGCGENDKCWGEKLKRGKGKRRKCIKIAYFRRPKLLYNMLEGKEPESWLGWVGGGMIEMHNTVFTTILNFIK